MRKSVVMSAICLGGFFLTTLAQASRLMENLDRGVVAVYKGNGQVYIGWRMFGTDPDTVSFNVYRNNVFNVYRNDVKVNTSPITDSTNVIDTHGHTTDTYSVATVLDGVEQDRSDPVVVWPNFYHDITLRVPAGGTTPNGVAYSYRPNDASVGDLDGDGQYEIVLKWDPTNSKDNSKSGFTGHVYLDAYEMDGTFLWRIDLGRNIRAGAHYTQFMVYDLDGDGFAEVVCKTAPGTIDGLGHPVILPGDNPNADYRNSSGYILSGPEYLTVFSGQNGEELDTVPYVPPRGKVSDWGDSYGNRVDRFLACVAYLDGQRPSVVMCRGYYTRTVLAAWDFRDGQLTQHWVFDSAQGYPSYEGQGNHNLTVADVDGDGKDEIIYGSCTIDDDGTGLYSTGLGHGDALHVSDMDPDRPGLEVWQCHEGSQAGATFRDAATGEVLFDDYNAGDVGRACAAHIDRRYPGYQLWSTASSKVFNADGTIISTHRPPVNFLVWWTGDLQRELLDAVGHDGKNTILDKWNGNGVDRLLSLYKIPTDYSTASNNYTKATPCLSGDILGDWREEIILRSSDNTKLRIFTTTDLTHHRFYTLMHDPQYRLAIAWQNVGYNQPPHPSFYLGDGMSTPPKPDITLVNRDAGCAATPLTPYVKINEGTWQQISDVVLDAGQTITLSPLPTTDGSWQWTGPNQFSASTQDVTLSNFQSAQMGVYTATYTNDCGTQSSQYFNISLKALVAHLEFEGNLLDSSGFDNNVTATGNPDYGRGIVGQSIYLDGMDDVVMLPSDVANSNDLTVTAWVNWNGGDNWQRIFDFGSGTGQYLFLTPCCSDGSLRFAIKNGGSEQIVETAQLPIGTWVHVAVTLNNDTATLYVNGTTVASESDITLNPSDFNTTINYIGDSQFSADPLFDGYIDDFRIYNYALSSAEVATLAKIVR